MSVRVCGPAYGCTQIGPSGSSSRLCVFLATCAVLASVCQGACGISVSQSVVRTLLAPGETQTVSLEVVNDEQGAMQVSLELVDWIDDIDGVTRVLPVGSVGRSAAADLDLSRVSVRLLPGESTAVAIGARLPDDAEGTYWAGCLIREVPDGSGAADGMRIARRLLVRLLYTTPGATRSARVTNLQTVGSNPIALVAEIENTGSAELQEISGLFSAQDIRGNPVLENSPPGFSLLPGATARVTVVTSWGPQFAGDYLIRAVFDYGGETLVAGEIVLRLDPLDLSPIGGSSELPRDLDGDGWYEDVNGDGLPNAADVSLLLHYADSPEIQGNARAFDFDDDGRVTAADAAALAALLGVPVP